MTFLTLKKLTKTRAQVAADYFQRHGAARQRAQRDALAAPKLRLLLLNAPALGPWARAQVEAATATLGARRVLWLLTLRKPSGLRLDELAWPLVDAIGGPVAAPYQWLKRQLTRAGLTRGDYLTLPNC